MTQKGHGQAWQFLKHLDSYSSICLRASTSGASSIIVSQREPFQPASQTQAPIFEATRWKKRYFYKIKIEKQTLMHLPDISNGGHYWNLEVNKTYAASQRTYVWRISAIVRFNGCNYTMATAAFYQDGYTDEKSLIINLLSKASIVSANHEVDTNSIFLDQFYSFHISVRILITFSTWISYDKI